MKRLALLWGIGPNFTQRLGINNATTIAGYSGDGINLPNAGFTLVLPNTLTSENFPRSTQTQVVGINNVLTGGVIETVGFYIDSTSAQVPKTAHVVDFPTEVPEVLSQHLRSASSLWCATGCK